MDTSRATASSLLQVFLVFLPPDLLLLELPSVDVPAVETDCNPVRATAAAALMASFFSWFRATGGGFMVALLFMVVAGAFMLESRMEVGS